MKRRFAFIVMLIALLSPFSAALAQQEVAVIVDPAIGNGGDYGVLFVEEYSGLDYQYVEAFQNPHNDERVIIARGTSSGMFSLMSANWQKPEIDWAFGYVLDWIADDDGFVLVSADAQNPYAQRIDNQGNRLWDFGQIDDGILTVTPFGSQVLLKSDRSIYAVDLETGDETWRFDAPEGQKVSSLWVEDESKIFVETYDNAPGIENRSSGYGLDPATGSVTWSMPHAMAGIYKFDSLIVAYDDYSYNGAVYRMDTGQAIITLTNDRIDAVSGSASMLGTHSDDPSGMSKIYDSQTGELLVEFPGRFAGFSNNLALAYEYTPNASFARAYDPRAGEMVWEFQLESDFTVVPNGGTVRIGSIDDGVYLLDSTSGEVLQHWEQFDDIQSTTTSGGTFLANGAVLRRLDESWNVSWTAELTNPVRRLGMIEGTLVAVTGEEASTTLLGIAPNTGEQVWSVDLPEASENIQWFQSGNVLHIGTESRHIAIDTASGTILWQANKLGNTELIQTNGDSAMLAVWTAARDRVLQVVIIGQK